MGWSLAQMARDEGLSGVTAQRQRWGVAVDGTVMSWSAGYPVDSPPDLSELVDIYRDMHRDEHPEWVVSVVAGPVLDVPVEWL